MANTWTMRSSTDGNADTSHPGWWSAAVRDGPPVFKMRKGLQSSVKENSGAIDAPLRTAPELPRYEAWKFASRFAPKTAASHWGLRAEYLTIVTLNTGRSYKVSPPLANQPPACADASSRSLQRFGSRLWVVENATLAEFTR